MHDQADGVQVRSWALNRAKEGPIEPLCPSMNEWWVACAPYAFLCFALR